VDGRFEFTDVLEGELAWVSVRGHERGVSLIVLTGEGGKKNIAVMLPAAVAGAVGRCLISPPAADTSISDMMAAGFELENRSPAEVMALDEAGELDDEALDDGLWMALLGAGVSSETLSSHPAGVRMFYATRLVEWEVGNGGFSQALENARECLEEAIAGYEMLGDHESTELLQRAIERSKALEALDEELEGPPWEGVPWGDARRLAYVRAHRDEFRF
jgi:hypothetical protein